MQEFIQSAASKLGINEDQAKSATGGVLNMLKDQGGGQEADALISKIPGAEDVMQSTASGGEAKGRARTGRSGAQQSAGVEKLHAINLFAS